MSLLQRLAAVLLSCAAAGAATAQQSSLNLYSARHYQTDEALYDNFILRITMR